MWLYTLVLAFSSACTTWGHPSSPPVVDTVHGKVLGQYVSLEGSAQPVAIFLGVPFAKPPLGPLRFAPPQPAEPWSSVKNATSYPPMCSQGAVAGQFTRDLLTNRKENILLQFSEDCLYTPADLTRRNRLPAMVGIHEGLVVGRASTYDGLPLSAHKNVVVVTIQYRLGAWGFFSHQSKDTRPSWSHLDQVAALRWVQDNIASFGGDPGSVAIFGESAGGDSVSVLVWSPLPKNLFLVRAALGSALHKSELFYFSKISQMAVTAGCKTTTSVVMVHCLHQKTKTSSWRPRRTCFDLFGDPGEVRTFGFLITELPLPVLPKMPEEILAAKNFNTVPSAVGFNKQEFGRSLPVMMGIPPSEGKLDQKTATSLLWKAYPIVQLPEERASVKDLFLDLREDVMFAVPSVMVARGHRDAGAPTYMYEFEYGPSCLSDVRPSTVTGDHGDELFSVFGAPFLKGGASEEETKLSRMVMRFWANFARHGNPNGAGLPLWPEYDQEEGYLQIGATTQAAARLKDKEVAFWTERRARKCPQRELGEL
uniref:Carboxylic ester hydrolase n=1 Tax=Ictidomys tridecemlineatus TaxID=43179 RepID=I3MUR2_ICTTR